MHINNSTRFILQSVIAGLAIALVILLFRPDLANLEMGREQAGSDGKTVQSFSTAVSRAAPAVVNVYASKVYQEQLNPLFQDPLFQRFFGKNLPKPGKRRESNLGSGVIMSRDGYILTNAHVIENMDNINVTLNDGRQAVADVIGIDSDTDLAVLSIHLEKLPVIEIGNSNKLLVGDVVLAIGNPYDFGQTVTQGIISATGRKRLGISTYEDFIQTDADINPGNSGGALINTRGELIGINTAIITSSGGSQGIGLAIPVNIALNVMEDLIKQGFVMRGWLGIEAQVLPPDIVDTTGRKQPGILVAGVLKGGPADVAGIVPGDILLSIGGKQLTSPVQAIQMISHYKPDTSIDLQVLRGWETLTLKATVSQRPTVRN